MIFTNFGSRKIAESLNKLRKDILLLEQKITKLFPVQRQIIVKYHSLNKLGHTVEKTSVLHGQFKSRSRNNNSLTKISNNLFRNVKENIVNSNMCYRTFNNNNNKKLVKSPKTFNKDLFLRNLHKNCACSDSSDGKKCSSIKYSKNNSNNRSLQLINFSTNCNDSNKKDYGRSNYDVEVECAMNEQIAAEINACYTYLSMACYFGNTNVALPGAQGFYMKMHDEEQEHAHKLIKYQNLRGGTIHLNTIKASETQDWGSIGNALEVSLEMEKSLKEVTR